LQAPIKLVTAAGAAANGAAESAEQTLYEVRKKI
jgi:hypothetical protein